MCALCAVTVECMNGLARAMGVLLRIVNVLVLAPNFRAFFDCLTYHMMKIMSRVSVRCKQKSRLNGGFGDFTINT